jgi:hypothetical protein
MTIHGIHDVLQHVRTHGRADDAAQIHHWLSGQAGKDVARDGGALLRPVDPRELLQCRVCDAVDYEAIQRFDRKIEDLVDRLIYGSDALIISDPRIDWVCWDMGASLGKSMMVTAIAGVMTMLVDAVYHDDEPEPAKTKRPRAGNQPGQSIRSPMQARRLGR